MLSATDETLVAVAAHPPVTEGSFCPICLCEVAATLLVRLEGCGHSFCSTCMEQYCKTRLDNDLLPIRCPLATEDEEDEPGMSQCRVPLTYDEVQLWLGPTLYARYTRRLQLKANPNLRECPRCGWLNEGTPATWRIVCNHRVHMPARVPITPPPVRVTDPSQSTLSPTLRSRVVFKRSGSSQGAGSSIESANSLTNLTSTTLPPPMNGRTYGSFEPTEPSVQSYAVAEEDYSALCGYEYCYFHSDAHPGVDCSVYRAALEADPEFARSSALIATSTKPCPHCSACVELAGGCDHIRCPSCHKDWCYRCGCGNLAGKYVRSCPNCAGSYLDHQYFPRWCCLMILLLPLVLIISLLWMTVVGCIMTCSGRCRRAVPRIKHRMTMLCYPVIFCLIIAQVVHDDPMVEVMKELPNSPIPPAPAPYPHHVAQPLP